MSDDKELGLRVVRAPAFRWLAGMRWRFDTERHHNIWSRYTGADLCDDDGNPVTEASPFVRTQDKRIILDLSDAATVGALFSLLEERLNAQGKNPIVPYGGIYSFASFYGMFDTRTLENLVAGLEKSS